MTSLRKISGVLLCLSALLSFTSCSELMDELFGGDDEPIQYNYSTALAGKWRVVSAGIIRSVSGEVESVEAGTEVATSLEWIEFSNGQAHFHFSQPVTLDYRALGGTHIPSTQITDYTCDCELDGRGFGNFVFGFKSNETGEGYVETYTEYVMGDSDYQIYNSARLWAYGRDEEYATTLILYVTTDECVDYGYVMERYDK